MGSPVEVIALQRPAYGEQLSAVPLAIVPNGDRLYVSSASTDLSTVSGTGAAAISISPSPLSIKLDTPTDVPVVLTQAVLGAAAFYFAWTNQRQQIRASIAGFRSEWQQELRDALVEYSALTFEMHTNRVRKGPRYTESDEAFVIGNQILTARTKVMLMLDEGKEYNKKLDSAMDDVLNSIDNATQYQAAMRAFRAEARVILERAWKDMKRDLQYGPGSKRPWYKFWGSASE